MKRSDYLWYTAIGSLVGLDVYLDKRKEGATLSCAVRRGFRTEHPVGRAIFVAGWVYLSYWFIPHIVVSSLRELTDDWTLERSWVHERGD